MWTARTGEATDPEGPGAKIIAHVGSDSAVWGGSFASTLSERWPEPELAYRQWAEQGRWQDEGFGLGGLQVVPVTADIQVATMIARREGGATPLRYGALETCLHKLLRIALEAEASLHLPCIDGGDWGRVEAMLRKMLHPLDVVVYHPAGSSR